MPISPGRILILISVVLFAVAGLGGHVSTFSDLDLDSIGLGFFAAGHLV